MVMQVNDNLRFAIVAFFGYRDDDYISLLNNAKRYVERFGEPQEAIRYLSALAMTIASSAFSEHCTAAQMNDTKKNNALRTAGRKD